MTQLRYRKANPLIATLKQQGIQNVDALNAIASIPRERFIAEALAHKAYQNTALPIGQGQTISQPYIVAKMTEQLLEMPKKPQRVLEIGTGCGYQTAILATLFNEIYSLERIQSLQFNAKRKLHALDLYNVSMKHGDGWKGWQSKAPFDAIIVTAAASTLPETLLAQLSEYGRLVIPLGTTTQHLYTFDKHKDKVTTTRLEEVKFVPLVEGEIQF